MATHSRILAWRIPWTEEPGGLQCMGSRRVGHDCSSLACVSMGVRGMLLHSHSLKTVHSQTLRPFRS